MKGVKLAVERNALSVSGGGVLGRSGWLWEFFVPGIKYFRECRRHKLNASLESVS